MRKLFTLLLVTLAFLATAHNKDHRNRNPKYTVDTIPMIFDLVQEVDTGQFMPVIRHLSSYTTRYCTAPEAFEAQDWLKEQLEGYGLTVALQNFPFWGGNSSDNVIATLPGKVTPEEFVLVGSHYDSYSFSGAAPGADDNASGTSGVLEAARILSNYAFERSIVFCTFSAEEMGLIGSDYYASHAASAGMDILGYFNFDMIGYLYPGDEIHTDMIAPASALELENFYKDVVAIYVPGFEVAESEPIGGDSDHTSFNNNGYMGIFPFEDTPNYSPYIHTSQDLIGPSVNSPEMAKTFIQATLASLATLAIPFDSTVGIRPRPGKISEIRVFPNPAHEFVSVSNVYGKTMQVLISGVSGQTISEVKVKGQASIDISGLASGIYIIRCTGTDLNEPVRLVKP
jgi:hypothetical protein